MISPVSTIRQPNFLLPHRFHYPLFARASFLQYLPGSPRFKLPESPAHRPDLLLPIYFNLFCSPTLHFCKLSSELAKIYRQKLQQSVTVGELSEEAIASLLCIRVLLCIPQGTVDAAHAYICGRIFVKDYSLVLISAKSPVNSPDFVIIPGFISATPPTKSL
ncbi:hypothetical protein KSP40_PGU003189 [Platanthera guangdongensis]|uniref:Uncharacterized protein n=1 Tax=Platanthera guangdongensis TaxID=2320717 RepID=A0ABR2M345_9ASPA